MALPEFPFEIPTLGAVFPPTWVVIDNGNVSDKAVSDKIVEYLMAKFPPVLAVRREVLPGEEPDPMDLMAHGVIAVGGIGAQRWVIPYNAKMDPQEQENDGTVDYVEPIAYPIHMVKKAPEPYNHVCVDTKSQFFISSCQGAFPWLTIFLLAGWSAADTAKAGDKFCEGETKGIWVNGEKVSDT